MSPILGIYASSATPSHIVTNSYESISTVTVGAGGSSSVSFTSIPSTYTHLQIRIIAKNTTAGSGFENCQMRFNSDSGSNYTGHSLYGTGASAGSSANTSQTAFPDAVRAAIASNNGWGVNIIDILDYANTNKYKTMRSLGGGDNNDTNGIIRLSSGVWMSTSAINAISFPNSTYSQYSTFALYGIKGA